MDHGWWWVVFLFFLTENDEVKQAVLSKYTLSAFNLCVGSAACFVICLLEEFIGKPHILSDVLSRRTSHHADLLRCSKHFRISGTKHESRD